MARILGKMMVVNVNAILGGIRLEVARILGCKCDSRWRDKVWQLEETTAEAESRRRRCLGEHQTFIPFMSRRVSRRITSDI